MTKARKSFLRIAIPEQVYTDLELLQKLMKEKHPHSPATLPQVVVWILSRFARQLSAKDEKDFARNFFSAKKFLHEVASRSNAESDPSEMLRTALKALTDK